MAGRIRQPINEESLARYLATAVHSIPQPITISQFGFGQSNPTYLLTGTSPSSSKPTRFVLRKKPPGKLVSKTAHKVEREFRVLSALGSLPGRPVPVPQTFCLCEDEEVIGTPFYVMEFVDGRIFEDFLMPGVTAGDRTEMWRDAVKVLAELHTVDVDGCGLGAFGKKGGFYGRQVRTWEAICQAQAEVTDLETGEKVEELPYMRELMKFFGDERNMPRDRVSLVHGDYKIDNLIFHHKQNRVIGVLDWEMSTIGHPLSDLCNLFTKFTLATLPDILTVTHIPLSNPSLSSPAVSNSTYLPGHTPGLPTVDDLVSWYAEASGYDPRVGGELAYGMAFVIFRFAAICHGIAARWARRQASSEKARENGRMAVPLAQFAYALVMVAEKYREKL